MSSEGCNLYTLGIIQVEVPEVSWHSESLQGETCFLHFEATNGNLRTKINERVITSTFHSVIVLLFLGCPAQIFN